MSHFCNSPDKLRQGSDSRLPAFSSSFKITLSWAGLGTSHKTSLEKYKQNWQGFHQFRTRVFKTSWANVQPFWQHCIHAERKHGRKRQIQQAQEAFSSQTAACRDQGFLSRINFLAWPLAALALRSPGLHDRPEHKTGNLETLPVSLTNKLCGHGQLH